MSIDETSVREFASWWATKNPVSRSDLLADDFEHDSELGKIGLDEFLVRADISEPLQGVTFRAVLADGTHAIVVFEGVDPVTELAHRIGWFVEHRDGQIKKITAVDAVLNARPVR